MKKLKEKGKKLHQSIHHSKNSSNDVEVSNHTIHLNSKDASLRSSYKA